MADTVEMSRGLLQDLIELLKNKELVPGAPDVALRVLRILANQKPLTEAQKEWATAQQDKVYAAARSQDCPLPKNQTKPS